VGVVGLIKEGDERAVIAVDSVMSGR
jgi:hypothetical protein